MVSNAVAQNRTSSTIGYQLAAGNFGKTSSNLSQSIAIIAEANTANQSGLSTTPVQITNAKQAGDLYGYGSPMHIAARIFFPMQGGGTNADVWCYPQAAASGAAAEVQTITVTGTATASGTHYVKVAGRNNIDGIFYSVNIVSGDTATAIASKIKDAINAVTASPVSATSSAGVVTVTTKWAGLTSASVTLDMDISLAASIGVTYAIAETTAGSGTPAVTDSLNLFSTKWHTIVLNGYGNVSATLTELETFNGAPSSDPNIPATGRYAGQVFMPFIAFTGTVDDNPTSITSSRGTQCTIAECPAPLSPGMPIEAAANWAVIASNLWINAPHLDVLNKTLPDMPMPALDQVPAMQDYNTRDSYVKKGCSTVVIEDGAYKIKDFVTTFNDGTPNPAYQWCRNLNIDWNIQYGFKIIEEQNVLGFTIANDNDVVNATNVIKPKQLKALTGNYADDLVNRGLIVDAEFTKQSISVTINPTNPNRLDEVFNYKRSGIGRILATTVYAGFNFGN